MPQSLIDQEVGHKGLTEMHVVRTMHERKALMEKLSDGFIALPGGHGTLDEFCEILTWSQLGIHQKPCGILNTKCYYDSLLRLFNQAVEEGFLKAVHRDMVLVDESGERLIKRMRTEDLANTSKWIS